MTDESVLEAECAVFSRYLVNAAPSEIVTMHYLGALAEHGLASDRDYSPFDRMMIRVARRSPQLARFADAYCAILNRRGPLRRKLVLLAAILEHAPPTSDFFDHSLARGPAGALLRLVVRGIEFTLFFLLGAIVFLPLRLVGHFRAGGDAR